MRGSRRSSKASRPWALGFCPAQSLKSVAQSPFYTPEASMSSDSTRNWSRTYVAVIVTEIVTLMGLWWLQSHYGI